jgi:hypothetical protein
MEIGHVILAAALYITIVILFKVGIDARMAHNQVSIPSPLS